MLACVKSRSWRGLGKRKPGRWSGPAGIGIVRDRPVFVRLQFTVAGCFASSAYSLLFVVQCSSNFAIAFFTSSFEGLM